MFRRMILRMVMLGCMTMSLTAIKDTSGNRLRLAERYLEGNSIDDSIEQLAMRHMASIEKQEDKLKFRLAMDVLDITSLKEQIKAGMVKHFNAEELEFMTEIYSTDIGKRVMSKMGSYSAEMTPMIHNAIVRAAEKAMGGTGMGANAGIGKLGAPKPGSKEFDIPFQGLPKHVKEAAAEAKKKAAAQVDA